MLLGRQVRNRGRFVCGLECFFVAVVAFLADPVFAGEPGVPEAGREESSAVELTIADCVAICLEKNPDIRLAKLKPEIAEAQTNGEKDIFYPTVGVTAAYDRKHNTLDNRGRDGDILYYHKDEKTESDGLAANVSVTGTLPWGMQYVIDYDTSGTALHDTSMSRSLSRGADSFDASLIRGDFEEDVDGTSIEFLLRQPLLKGRGAGSTLANYRIAKNNEKIADEVFRAQVFAQVADLMMAYWDYVEALQEEKVFRSALAIADRFVKEAKTRIRIGTLAPAEIVQAEAGFVKCESLLTSALKAVKESETRLKALLGLENQDPLANASIWPKDEPHIREIELDEEVSMAKACKLRPELAVTEHAIENSSIEERFAKNQILPQLDAVASVGADLSRDRIHGYNVLSRYDFDGVKYSFALTASIPIGNKRANSEYLQARLGSKMSQEEKRKIEIAIAWEIRAAIDRVEAAISLIGNSRKLRDLEEAGLKSQEKLLGMGLATSFDVVQSQENLYEAKITEVGDLIDFEKTLIELRAAEGSILEDMGLDFE